MSPTEQVAGSVVEFGMLRLVDTVAPVKVGAVPKTNAPEPVSPVTADARFALEGVAKNVETPVPRPLTPAVMLGWPHVSVPLALMAVAKLLEEQSAGSAAKAVAVPALPETVPVTLPVRLPEKVPVVVPGKVGLVGIENVGVPEQSPLVTVI